MIHDPPSAAARRPSLDGIARVHRSDGSPRSRGARVLLRVSLAVAAGAVLLVAVVRDASLTVLLAPLGLAAFQIASWVAVRRSWTALEVDGVTVFRGLGRARSYPWAEIRSVVVAGRFADHSALRLRDGVEVPLPHVPADVAQHLRDELDPAPTRPPLRRVASGPVAAGPTGAGGPRPDDDLDMEGPFRRGPSRR